MVKFPKILLSVSKKGTTAENYEEALLAAGAGAVCIGSYPAYDASFDALLLPGGGDMDPSFYGEALNGSHDIDRERDKAELALIRAFTEAGKPILGICRGHQALNVAFGGTLWQHMPDAESHTGEEDRIHLSTALADSIVGRLYGESFPVNSSHHQAVKRLAPGFRATQWWTSPNGGRYVEAMEHLTLPIFSVQWHPERMTGRLCREDTPNGAAIFQYFVEMCRNWMENQNA